MPVVALTNRRTFLGLYAPEVLVLLFAVITFQLYTLLGLPLRHPLQYYLDRESGGLVSYPVCLLLALLALRLSHIKQAIKIRQAEGAADLSAPAAIPGGIPGIKDFLKNNGELISYRFTWDEFRRLYLAPKSLIFDLRMVHAISAMFVVFINMKHLIPRINSHLFDQHFAAVEYQFFGKLMTVWMIQKMGTGIAPFLSDGYTVWYAYMAVCCLLMVLQRNRLLTEEFASAFILMWMLAMVAVYITPSWGPCFYFKERLATIMPITKMAELQDGLWKGREFVLANPASPKGTFLISGFPSLHFAATILCTFYLWRLYRPFAALSLIFTVVTFFTTIYFGWHYLMDDIGAVLLVALVLVITRRFYRTHIFFVEPRPEVIKMGTI